MTVNLQQSAEFQQVQMVIVDFVYERLGADDRDELSRRLRVIRVEGNTQGGRLFRAVG